MRCEHCHDSFGVLNLPIMQVTLKGLGHDLRRFSLGGFAANPRAPLCISRRLYSTESQTSADTDPVQPPGSRTYKAFLIGFSIPLLAWATDKAFSTPSHPTKMPEILTVPGRPQYGSPQDFQKAILELQSAFSSDSGVISVDPGVLYEHGFSDNDYHDGMLSVSLVSSIDG